MSEKKDLIGLRFMHLLVLEEAGSDKNGRAMWLCKCDCGNEKISTTKYLGKGTSSCGCLAKEIKRMAEDNESKTGTESVNALYFLEDLCKFLGL